MLLNFFCINVMHLVLDRNKRPMSYLMQKPKLQLDNYEILSIEILFHTQCHIDKSTKKIIHKETKNLCYQVDKKGQESQKYCITLYRHEL